MPKWVKSCEEKPKLNLTWKFKAGSYLNLWYIVYIEFSNMSLGHPDMRQGVNLWTKFEQFWQIMWKFGTINMTNKSTVSSWNNKTSDWRKIKFVHKIPPDELLKIIL